MINKSEEVTNEEIPVLIVMNDPIYGKIYKSQLEESCKLKQLTSMAAFEEFEKTKTNFDFVIINASCLEAGEITVIESLKKLRSKPQFQTTIFIAIGSVSKRKKIVGDDLCHLECLPEVLAQFLEPLILDLQNKKNLLKKENLEKGSDLRVA